MKYNRLSLQNFLGDLRFQINPTQEEIENFRAGISIIENEKLGKKDEEYEKNNINQFLRDTYKYNINTKGKIDAVIYEDNKAQVIFEVKAFKNKTEFPKTPDSLESKAFRESILYYLRESHTEKNNNIKHIILCNIRQFYIIDAKEFHKCFANDKEIIKSFENTELKQGNDDTTNKFYKELGEYLPALDKEISYTYFELTSSSPDIALIYSILSPIFLLKRRSYIDANTLNQAFYDELLYILGLQEKSENGKIIIPSDAQNTFLSSITQKLSLDREKDFEKIFSLLTTWNNRILFLRLLESMLLSFRHLEKPFLDAEVIKDFETLSILFFDVLAEKEEERGSDIPIAFENIPYLNSSLFDKTILEKEPKDDGENKQIQFLSSKPLDLHPRSILKKSPDYKDKSSLPLLEYLFAFLHSYDFTTTPKDIVNHTKTNSDKLINSAVLGLVFEKLNGYKEGSFYTPSFITSYMCRQSLEKIVIDKFNALKGWKCENIIDIKNHIGSNTRDIKEADEIFYQIKICDPAVGSGHYLVSALNELIYIKWRMGILCDEEYGRIEDIELRLDNDEIIITQNGKPFSYTIPESENTKSQIIQKSIFNVKRKIIENCLFGVDINPNSCEITRLRLWIELLKYSYYKDIAKGRLETLPNIDINIKAGNSLLSNFPIDSTKDSLYENMKNKINKNRSLENKAYYDEIIDDIQKKFIPEIKKYNDAVRNYKNQTNKDLKNIDKDIIKNSQDFFKGLFLRLDPIVSEFRNELAQYACAYGYEGFGCQEETDILNTDDIKKVESFIQEFEFHRKYNIPPLGEDRGSDYKTLKKLVDLMHRYNKLYSGQSFEWRFEFPEVLDENGDFIGFDLVIGNPPYIKQELLKDIKPHLSSHFDIYSGTSDIYTYFFEQGYKVLKDRGRLSFITSNKWTRAGYGEKLRSFILEKTSLETYVEFNGVKVFDSATVDTSIVEFIKQTSKDHNFKYISITTKPKDASDITSTTPQLINTSTLSSEAFTFGDSATIALKQKIESIGTPLKDWDINIYRGILTGYNEAFIIDTTKKDEILSKCDDSKDSHLPFELIDGHYIRCEDNKEAILLTEKERTAQIIRPILRGKDIKRYSYEWADKWVIGTHNGYKIEGIDIPPIAIEEYPALKAYLDTFYTEISKRQDKGITPYNLRNCAYMNEFARQKIVWAEMTKESCFVYDEDGYLTNQTCYFMPNASKYLLGILNSKIIYFYMKEISSTLGENSLRWIKQFIEKLPVPKTESKNQKLADEIIAVVDKIIKLKNKKTNTKDLESKIDDLVYKLYNLTPEEIAIIESV